MSNPITIVSEPGRQYTSKYNGLEQLWDSGPEERVHKKVVVAQDKKICYGHAPEGDWDVTLTEFLPSPEGYKYIGKRQHRGRLCDLWEKTEDTPKKSTWKLYLDENGYPVSYMAQAISFYHSHYDVYVLDIDTFIPDVLPGYWNPPADCDSSNPSPYPNTKKRFYGRRHSTKNADAEPLCRTYHYQNSTLPKEFSWRDVEGVVGKPRDQAACGSCWAFGTAQSLESQIALKLGKFEEISVNQIMDCTWNEQNSGCQGGESAPAFRTLIESKLPLTYEKNYPYMGVSGYCSSNVDKPVARVVDCIHIEPKTNALKEAIMKFGPASVGINVLDSMSYYTGGVVDDKKCTGVVDDLVHEVLVTGWRVIDGKNAWEIKNSWSTHWGDQGYLYIQSDNQEWNCGVTTDATIPFIEIA